ncbi:4-hydroxy-3-methylbut-2-enyl diphosphate reductase [Nibricoccus sp. IMCC34717]|uniref:4-hydroxy-3-methylbut-2-enyl diphosphate reductase n=1 Tax=Nibricoccus sp. IMCC34717 TaxID=3034021 RepID=UPI003850C03C
MVATSTLGEIYCILAFTQESLLVVAASQDGARLAFAGSDAASAMGQLGAALPNHTKPVWRLAFESRGRTIHVALCQVRVTQEIPGFSLASIESLQRGPVSDPTLAAVLAQLEPVLIEVPYLHLGENDFIYTFRPDKERNRGIYKLDTAAEALYQSRLCAAIKELARLNERTAAEPVVLDFGAVHYVIPSHFGFCLGVKNAIERAYETLAENPGRRVFMLSELIHNPFVNEDLLRRGLRYLQSEKGRPYTVDGNVASGAAGERTAWDDLTPEDIVIIPAFGATDDDKRRLVRKGLPVYPFDATCMLVEKVWKAARAFGRDGYTVLIHGKHEHEETKATFSNARRHAPALIIRNLEEARLLGDIILSDKDQAVAQFEQHFQGKHTPGFDPVRHLERIAMVNQTTLLMNETLEIIAYLRSVFEKKYGREEAERRIGGGAKRDTLCYATQVNQDALGRALQTDLDAAFVIGGKNSSNTFQLFRLCEQRLGRSAYFIQSETNLLGDEVEHFVFPHSSATETGFVRRPLALKRSPSRVLLTGGASCPDGIIQQVIHRLNSRFPAASLRPIEAVLADLETRA